MESEWRILLCVITCKENDLFAYRIFCLVFYFIISYTQEIIKIVRVLDILIHVVTKLSPITYQVVHIQLVFKLMKWYRYKL